jgi:hypothetical protein
MLAGGTILRTACSRFSGALALERDAAMPARYNLSGRSLKPCNAFSGSSLRPYNDTIPFGDPDSRRAYANWILWLLLVAPRL